MQSLETSFVAALANPLQAEIELDQLDCADSLSAYIRSAWHVIEPGQPYRHNWHIDAVAEHLEAVTAGEITRLLINEPPGTMKSIECGVMWPSWEWGPKGLPNYRIIGSSYSERYAIRDNGRMRNLVQSEWYQARWGNTVRLIKEGEKKFENSAYGWREAIPFAGLTAGRGDRLIIDDPHSTETAESDAERERATRIFLESVPTRLNNPDSSAIVIVMQRLHEQDVSGIALEKDLGYVHLCLPMEFEPARKCYTVLSWDQNGKPDKVFEDPRSEEGELLFPTRFPREVVERDKRTMGSYAVAGQFQQRPSPRGGGIFKTDWWKLWPPEGEEFDRRGAPLKPLAYPKFEYLLASVDTAMSTKEEADFSACSVWGVWQAPASFVLSAQQRGEMAADPLRPVIKEQTYRVLMLVWAWAERLEFKALVDKIIDTCRKRKVDRLLIEPKANGISVAQEIRRLCAGESFGVTTNLEKGDKVARAYAVSHLLEGGLVYAPERNWSRKVIDEMASFPRGAHDDLTDTATGAMAFLRKNGLLQMPDERDEEVREQSRPRGGKPRLPYDV